MRQVEVAKEGGNDSLKPSDEARARQGDRSTTGADVRMPRSGAEEERLERLSCFIRLQRHKRSMRYVDA